LLLSRLIDEEYTRHPFYGTRKWWSFCCGGSYRQSQAGAAADATNGTGWHGARPNTSRPHPEHKVYPYLLRGVPVVRPNQVWSTDITYIRLPRRLCLPGGDHRLVLAPCAQLADQQQHGIGVLRRLPGGCLRIHGKPEIFNSDQGSQFTSVAFTEVLEREGVVISMDGRGRVFDNIFVERLWRSVKYEDVYLKGYATMGELMVGLTRYFAFYNGERPHQSLDKQNA
jgi:putative transposase